MRGQREQLDPSDCDGSPFYYYVMVVLLVLVLLHVFVIRPAKVNQQRFYEQGVTFKKIESKDIPKTQSTFEGSVK